MEKKGARCILLINKGFQDLLHIGNQTREDLFTLKIKKPDLLYEKVIEVDERIEIVHEPVDQILARNPDTKIVHGLNGNNLIVRKEPEYLLIESQLKKIIEEDKIDSVGIVLLHSYNFSEHERKIGEIAKKLGFKNISMSHEVFPMIRIVPRGIFSSFFEKSSNGFDLLFFSGFTTVVDAYLTPAIKEYISNFRAGFKNSLAGVNVTFMQSDGSCFFDEFLFQK